VAPNLEFWVQSTPGKSGGWNIRTPATGVPKQISLIGCEGGTWTVDLVLVRVLKLRSIQEVKPHSPSHKEGLAKGASTRVYKSHMQKDKKGLFVLERPKRDNSTQETKILDREVMEPLGFVNQTFMQTTYANQTAFCRCR
jgi:hypothetical protein